MEHFRHSINPRIVVKNLLLENFSYERNSFLDYHKSLKNSHLHIASKAHESLFCTHIVNAEAAIKAHTSKWNVSCNWSNSAAYPGHFRPQYKYSSNLSTTMETFIKVLLSGYLVGLTCMGYLLVRSYEVHFGEDNKGPVVTISKDLSANWLGIALFSMTVSYTWCLIGAAVFTLVSSNTQFLHFSLAIAMLCAAAIFITNTKRKMDKIAISFIVVIGTCLMFVHVF